MGENLTYINISLMNKLSPLQIGTVTPQVGRNVVM